MVIKMDAIYDFIINLITTTGSLGMMLDCLLIVSESIIPALPLGLFITVLCVNYGYVIGFLISWIFTIIGCMISYYLFQTIFKGIVDRKLRKYEFANKLLTMIDKMTFSNLVLLISLPITPAFLVNIVAGVSNMKVNKFLPALMIGKISLVAFWGYVGTSLIEGLKNPKILIKVGIIIIIMWYKMIVFLSNYKSRFVSLMFHIIIY